MPFKKIVLLLCLVAMGSAQAFAEDCEKTRNANFWCWNDRYPTDVILGRTFFEFVRASARGADKKTVDDFMNLDLKQCTFAKVRPTEVQDPGAFAYSYSFSSTAGTCTDSGGPYQVMYGGRSYKTNGYGGDSKPVLGFCASYVGHSSAKKPWTSYDKIAADGSGGMDCRSSNAMRKVFDLWRYPPSSGSSSGSVASAPPDVYVPQCTTGWVFCRGDSGLQCPVTTCN